MAELTYSDVSLYKEEHTYVTSDGVVLSGVTSILSRNMFKDKYKGIKSEVLTKAAECGSYIHEQLQELDDFGSADDIPEVNNYIALKEKHSITPLANEYLVSDHTQYATMIDMVDNEFNLYDFKTTAKLDVEYLSWQLSINAYLFEIQNPKIKAGKLYAIWLKGDICELREIDRISATVVENLLFCDSNELPFNYTLPDKKESEDIQRVMEVENFIIQLDAYTKQVKEQKEMLLAAIKQSMEENGMLTYESQKVKISISKPSERTTFDSATFKEADPETYAKYTKTSQVKSSIRLTIKKPKINEQTSIATLQC